MDANIYRSHYDQYNHRKENLIRSESIAILKLLNI
jgi:hypothetical protein